MKRELYLYLTIANLVWFGFWFVWIFHGHSIWWILVPIFCHWQAKDYKTPPK